MDRVFDQCKMAMFHQVARPEPRHRDSLISTPSHADDHIRNHSRSRSRSPIVSHDELVAPALMEVDDKIKGLGLREFSSEGRLASVPNGSGEELGSFLGTITSFSDRNGYGFIECKELKQAGHGDAWLNCQQKRNYMVGHIVRFTAYVNEKGKTQAKDLTSGLKGENGQAVPHSTAAGAENVLGEYLGKIKSFNDVNGYGFIECEDVKGQGYQDVFLNAEQKRNYQVGHTVKFTAYLNEQGKPQARGLKSGCWAPWGPVGPHGAPWGTQGAPWAKMFC